MTDWDNAESIVATHEGLRVVEGGTVGAPPRPGFGQQSLVRQPTAWAKRWYVAQLVVQDKSAMQGVVSSGFMGFMTETAALNAVQSLKYPGVCYRLYQMSEGWQPFQFMDEAAFGAAPKTLVWSGCPYNLKQPAGPTADVRYG